MLEWLKRYNEASSQTKYFILNWLVYGLAIIITTVYCFARLNYVRSYQSPSTIEANQAKEKT